MIPEIGHFALLLALAVAVVPGVVPLLGASRGNPARVDLARPVPYLHPLVAAIPFSAREDP